MKLQNRFVSFMNIPRVYQVNLILFHISLFAALPESEVSFLPHFENTVKCLFFCKLRTGKIITTH
jgi:hypothetical protein